MKRIGPELKLSKLRSRSASSGTGDGIKVPPFLNDLYQDLRDRRLLPLVVLLLVGIVAAPILLGGGGPEGEEEAAVSPPVASASNASGTSLTVVEAHPGLRSPGRRLAYRTPTDPFTQRYTGSVRNGGLPNEESTSTTSTSEGEGGSVVEGGTTAGSGTPAPPESALPEGSGGSSGGAPAGDLSPGHLYTFTIDVQISRTEEKADGSKKMGEPTVRKDVKPPEPLPGAKAPVVTYLGINYVKGKPRALLMVSRDVSAVYGDSKCVSGTSSCELLEVEPGFPEIFEYGPNAVRYKFNVLKIEIAADGNL
jgi:hypothetical protein